MTRRRARMAEVLVWRVEKADTYSAAGSRGPYGACGFDSTHNDMKTHPSPFKDEALVKSKTPVRWNADPKMLGIRNEEYCGTASLRELAEWFRGYGKVLADKGFKVVALAVDEQFVRRGRRQLVFVREKARVIHSMSPYDHIETKEDADGNY
jgi:hypothetical protein